MGYYRCRGQYFQTRYDTIGKSSSEANRLSQGIDINGQIQEGILSFIWTSNYQGSIIEEIANNFKERLEALIVHCSKEDVYGYTPSDFEMVNINQEQLEKLSIKLKGKKI